VVQQRARDSETGLQDTDAVTEGKNTIHSIDTFFFNYICKHM